MHPRTQIRELAKGRIEAALAATYPGVPVQCSRTAPWTSRRLPAVGIYTLLEDSERINAGQFRRETTLAVDLVAGQTDDLDQVMDDLSDLVESALLADPSLGLGRDRLEVDYTGLSATFDYKGDRPLGGMRLTFTAKYVTTHAPDISGLDDFKTADIVWKPDGATDESPNGEDTITLTSEEDS